MQSSSKHDPPDPPDPLESLSPRVYMEAFVLTLIWSSSAMLCGLLVLVVVLLVVVLLVVVFLVISLRRWYIQ